MKDISPFLIAIIIIIFSIGLLIYNGYIPKAQGKVYDLGDVHFPQYVVDDLQTLFFKEKPFEYHACLGMDASSFVNRITLYPTVEKAKVWMNEKEFVVSDRMRLCNSKDIDIHSHPDRESAQLSQADKERIKNHTYACVHSKKELRCWKNFEELGKVKL